MDREVKWSPAAVADLEDLAAYIARDSEYYARAIVLQVLQRLEHIKLFPHSGRIVPELADEDMREVFVHSYRVIAIAYKSSL